MGGHTGGLTLTGEDKTLVSDASENAFLGALPAAEFPALPGVGEWLEQGAIYNADGTLVMVRQPHARTLYPPAETPALFVVYREDAADVLAWVAGESVGVGTLRTYGDDTYRALQAHVTQADWTPPAVPALWALFAEEPPTDEWATGVSYTAGDVVTYGGAEYECRQSHTSQVGWEPPNVLALWLPL